MIRAGVKEGCSPGWTAPAALSVAPEMLSPTLEEVDFWESGVTAGCVSVMPWWMAGLQVLTLLRRLLAETLAEVVRHVDGWLVGWFGFGCERLKCLIVSWRLVDGRYLEQRSEALK